MVLYVPSLTSVYFEPKFDEFVITGGDFTVFDAISDQSSPEYSRLESVQPLRKDEAGNEISKERVLSTLLEIGPSFGESCEIKADCYFVQVCCRWCCRTSDGRCPPSDGRRERRTVSPP